MLRRGHCMEMSLAWLYFDCLIRLDECPVRVPGECSPAGPEATAKNVLSPAGRAGWLLMALGEVRVRLTPDRRPFSHLDTPERSGYPTQASPSRRRLASEGKK